MKKVLVTLVMAICIVMLASIPAKAIPFTDAVDVYTIGTSVTISWNHVYDGSASPEATASLAIVAEGVDVGENDEVYLNGTLLGELTQQPFYYSGFEINAGPGALGAPQTELTMSIFNFDPSLLLVGLNAIDVVVDPSNWIVEIETSLLTVNSVPEPGTLLLLGTGLIGLAYSRRKLNK